MKFLANIHKNKAYNLLVRIVIILATYFFVYKKLFHSPSLSEISNIWNSTSGLSVFEKIYGITGLFFTPKTDFIIFFKDVFKDPNLYLFGIWVLILMVVNWGIESLKWQFLINKIENVSFFKSFEAVLSGVSVSIFTPNRIGEWFGRVFILKKSNPWKGVFITMIGSFSQLLITLIVGSISLAFYVPIYFKDHGIYSNYLLYGLIFLVIVIIGTSLLVFLNITSLPLFLSRILHKRFVLFNDYVSVISDYSGLELLTVLLLSFLRYCVFTLQFYILLMMFSIEIPLLHGLMIISLIFFIMTAIPTVTMAELGVRGSVSLYFIDLYFAKFGAMTENIDIGVVSSTSTLWLINLAVPAILGTFFVYRLNFFRKRSS